MQILTVTPVSFEEEGIRLREEEAFHIVADGVPKIASEDLQERILANSIHAGDFEVPVLAEPSLEFRSPSPLPFGTGYACLQHPDLGVVNGYLFVIEWVHRNAGERWTYWRARVKTEMGRIAPAPPSA